MIIIGEPSDDSLSVEELSLVKELIRRECFDLELQGEDIVLLAVHIDPNFDKWIEQATHNPLLMGGSSVVNVAKIKFLPMVSSSVHSLIEHIQSDYEDVGEDENAYKEQSRVELLALAGLLREAARYVEKEAASLIDYEWGREIGTALEPMKD